MDENEWLKFEEFTKRVNGTISGSGLRHIIFNREENGADYFLRKLGSKWLLSPKKFYEWIDQKGGK